MSNLLTDTKSHINRLKSGVYKRFNLSNVTEWVLENTYLKGEKFSFKDHEYQLAILRDPSREIVVRKCSQIGISELSARRTLAHAMIMPGFTTIFTLPTASFASTFVKTRIDPIIDGSPALAAAVHNSTNSSGVKRFGESFLYFKGTYGTNAAISIPADSLVHDEKDFSNLEVITNYQSRLSHSKHKLRLELSTPTVEGYGISEAFAMSRKHYNLCKCHHCNHTFVPGYYEHVRVDGVKDLREITKETIVNYDLSTARLECPKCGKIPSLQIEHRECVIENNSANFEASGYQISPFDAPNSISLKDLIISGTRYKRNADFVNFGLGLPAEDKESGLNLEDLNPCFVPWEMPSAYTAVMGLDMGLKCHCMIGFVDYHGVLHTIHTEVIPVQELEVRLRELRIKYRVRLTVADSQPYVETIYRLQQSDPNLYAAIYVATKNLDVFQVKIKDEAPEKGVMDLRQVNISRNRAFDALSAEIRAGKWLCRIDENHQDILTQLQDQKRIQVFDSDQELSFVWRKTKGNDHFHNSLSYLRIASLMVGLTHTPLVIPRLMTVFKNKGSM